MSKNGQCASQGRKCDAAPSEIGTTSSGIFGKLATSYVDMMQLIPNLLASHFCPTAG